MSQTAKKGTKAVATTLALVPDITPQPSPRALSAVTALRSLRIPSSWVRARGDYALADLMDDASVMQAAHLTELARA